MPARVSTTAWLWALLPLLLAAALVIPLLDVDAFSGDELLSLLATGIQPSGRSLDVNQAHGWPVLLFIWGRLAGWSEIAARAIPFFAGLLTLAWVYRAGRDLFAPAAGLFAALLLGSSVFFLSFMSYARAFTLVTLFTSMSLWAYWRVALRPGIPDRRARAGLLLGTTGLLYSHYFAALLLPALGLYHLIFVRKNRRWWQPVFLLGLTAMLTLPQLPAFIQGLEKTVSHEGLHSRALSATALLLQLVRRISNDLLDPPAATGDGVVVVLFLLFLVLFLYRLRTHAEVSFGWMLVFVSGTLLLLILVVNEVIKAVPDNRIRYLMPLWPLGSLLAGTGLWRLLAINRGITTALLTIWLVAGVFLISATGYRYELEYFTRSDFHRFIPLASEYVPATDLLIMDFEVATRDGRQVYAKTLDGPWDTLYRYREDPYETIRPAHAAYTFLWLLYRTKDRVSITDMPGELGRVFCERALEEWGFTLERYALHSVENCPDSPVRLQFDSDIQLTAPEITVSDGLLRLDAHFRSADETLLARYSLAVHVIDQGGPRVAQGDTGVGPGAIVPLRSEIDVSALPPGDYELRVALYDWQTGARLSARDLENDEVSDIHTLHRFRLH